MILYLHLDTQGSDTIQTRYTVELYVMLEALAHKQVDDSFAVHTLPGGQNTVFEKICVVKILVQRGLLVAV